MNNDTLKRWSTWLRDALERTLVVVAAVVAAIQVFEDNLPAAGALGAGVAAVAALLARFSGNRSSASFQPNLPKDQVIADPPTKEGMG